MTDDIVGRLRSAALSGDMPLGQSFDCAAVADELERVLAERDRWKACAEAYHRFSLARGDDLFREAIRG